MRRVGSWLVAVCGIASFAAAPPAVAQVAPSGVPDITGATDAPATVRPGASTQSSDGALSLAFDAAPLPTVIDTVVGRMLRRTFVVDPGLRDRTVTLRATRPVPRADVLALLDQALRLSGAGLVERPDGSVEVLPADRLQGLLTTPTIAGDPKRVGSLLIVPLKYVSAKEMGKVLESVADRRSVVRVDEAREALVLSGDAQSLATLADTIALFDVDWLASTSFDLVPVHNAPADVIATDVRRVLGGDDGLVGSQVELAPLSRLRAVLVIAKRQDRLPAVRAWIERLDAAPPGDGRTVHFLGVKNLPAEEVASTLAGLLNGNASGGGEGTAVATTNSTATSSRTDAADGDHRGELQTSHSSLNVALGSGVRIQPAPQTNGLLVYASDAEFSQISATVSQIDVAPVQIMIEATVVEVVLNDQLKYGVQWFFDTRDQANATFSTASNGAIASSFPGFSYRFQGTYARATLNALSAVTDVNVISSPQLVALSGQSARLQIGDQVPVVTQTATGVQNDARIINSVEYRDTGVVLSVRPRAGSDGLVVVDIDQEVSDVSGTTTSGIDSPTIQQRRFETRVAIQDGETIALGGLIRSTRSRGVTGVPGLHRLPGLGAAFRAKDKTERRTELIVYLTPHVMRSSEDAHNVTGEMSERLEKLRQTPFGRTEMRK